MLDKMKRALGAKTLVENAREGATGDSDNLLAWWHTEFTPEEQHYILAKHQPAVVGTAVEGEGLDLSRIIRPDGSLGLIGSLAALSTWFMSGDDIPLARRILAKSVERQESETGSVIDRHFIYYHMIRVYYRDRNRDKNALALAIETCEKQIALAPEVIRERPQEWGGFCLRTQGSSNWPSSLSGTRTMRVPSGCPRERCARVGPVIGKNAYLGANKGATGNPTAIGVSFASASLNVMDKGNHV